MREEEAFDERVRRRLAAVEGAPAKLRVILEECSSDYDVDTWIRVWSLSRRDAGVREVRQRLDDHFRRMIEEVIAEGQRSGEFGDLPAGEVALTLAAIVDGYAVQATLHDVRVTSGYMLSAFVEAAELLLGCPLPPVDTAKNGAPDA